MQEHALLCAGLLLAVIGVPAVGAQLFSTPAHSFVGDFTYYGAVTGRLYSARSLTRARSSSDACISVPAGDQQGAGHCSFQYASPSAFTLPWTNGITSGAAMNAPQAGTSPGCSAGDATALTHVKHALHHTDKQAAQLRCGRLAVQQLSAMWPVSCIQRHRQGLGPDAHTDHRRALHHHY